MDVRQLARRIAGARPRSVLAVGWLWLFLYGFPGQMTPDCYEHLIEARSGLYTDGNPPVINLIYWLSDHTFGGQVLVFFLQITAFVAGAYLALRRLVPRHAHWIALGFVLFPPVFTTMSVVWKDALMPALLLLGIGGLLDDRRWARLLGLAALFGAIAIRYNAFAAAFPLVVLLFAWRDGLGWIKRTAIALVAWAAITGAAFQVNAALTDQQMHLWYSSLALFDIAGVLKNVDGTIPDAELGPLLAGTGLRVERDIHQTIRKQYRVRNFFFLVSGPKRIWDTVIRGTEPPPKAQRDAVGRAWKALVSAHKGAYLLHRARVFRELLAFRHDKDAYWAVPLREYGYPEAARRIGVSFAASNLQHAASHVLDRVWHVTPLFEAWMYLMLSLLLVPFALRHRDVLAILGSGIGIQATLFFLASSPDYRYSHWMVITTCLALVTLIARRSQAVVARGGDEPALVPIAGEDPVDAGAPRDVA